MTMNSFLVGSGPAGWFGVGTAWQRMLRPRVGRLSAALVDGLVNTLDWALALIDLALQIVCVAYMLFYQVNVPHKST